MEKSTYSKTFTGYGFDEDTAKDAYVVCSLPLDDKTSFYYAFPSKKRAELESNGKVIRKIKVTFSVTVEPA